MKPKIARPAIVLVLTVLAAICAAPSQPRVSAYYSGYSQGTASSYHLRASQIDFDAVTLVIHFALLVNPDGSLNDQTRHVDSANADSIVTAAHAAGKKVLICAGGASSESGFVGATGSQNVASFINNLIALDTSRHYDGIDIDWEPLTAADTSQYAAFITGLWTAMEGVTPRLRLTAATAWQPAMFARLQTMFDQINIMTYDLSGPYAGWVTWHNAPIFDGGYSFPGRPTEYLPCANALVDTFETAGVAPQKLGIGIDFYGAVWSGGDGTPTGGVTAPRQSWTVAPTVTYKPYYEIMDSLYQPADYRWDTIPEAAYLSIDSAGSAGDKFISYDDENSCRAKISYVRSKGIGGVILWELGGGWRPGAPVPDTLLRAVGLAAFGTLSVASSPAPVPEGYALDQNYPNPFNPSTLISYDLPLESHVNLAIYNTLGAKVATLADLDQPAGSYHVRWDAGQRAGGVYFCRLLAGRYSATRVLLFIK